MRCYTGQAAATLFSSNAGTADGPARVKILGVVSADCLMRSLASEPYYFSLAFNPAINPRLGVLPLLLGVVGILLVALGRGGGLRREHLEAPGPAV